MKMHPSVCINEGHIPPSQATEPVTNCVRCGRRLYAGMISTPTSVGTGTGYVAKPDEVKPPLINPIGFFNWRKTLKGEATCEKVLQEHVDHWQATNKGSYNQVYRYNLLHSTPLDDVQWGLTLQELTKRFPCPEFEGPRDAK